MKQISQNQPAIDLLVNEIKLENPAFFLDYDGTLVPIVLNPEDALPSTDLMDTLRELDDRYRLFIVTGRSLQEMLNFIGDGFNIIALHGAMTSLKGDLRYNVPNFQQFVRICDDIYEKRDEYLHEFLGVRIYNKGANVLFHTGLMQQEYLGGLKDRINKLAAESGMAVYSGKRIIELRIPGINKGIAIRQYSDGMKKLIAGDDNTDEDAFRENPDAITIHVGPGESIARYRLPDPEQMLNFLRKIV
ncbi:MAG: trehalose-phosphatase [Candidatus Thermoplasmatota archaeon]|nr:trehalose-phosphatase [Candidatus Thermoplasmatota archaeon]